MSPEERLAEAAAELAAARACMSKAKAKAVKAAQAASAAGMTDVDIAKTLNVDRARTLRRWLGK